MSLLRLQICACLPGNKSCWLGKNAWDCAVRGGCAVSVLKKTVAHSLLTKLAVNLFVIINAQFLIFHVRGTPWHNLQDHTSFGD